MKDISGKTFNRWFVDSYSRKANDQPTAQTVWNCICSCGTKREVQYGSLTSGRSKSCGCLRRESSSKRFKGKRQKWRKSKVKSSNRFTPNKPVRRQKKLARINNAKNKFLSINLET